MQIKYLKFEYGITNTILDVIQYPVSYLKHDISETGLCLCFQVKPTQLCTMDREILCLHIGPNGVGCTWRRRQNPVTEESCFK
jgi:hypothetical protein